MESGSLAWPDSLYQLTPNGYLLAAVAVAVTVYYWPIWRRSRYPRGPMPLPFLGNALLFFNKKKNFMQLAAGTLLVAWSGCCAFTEREAFSDYQLVANNYAQYRRGTSINPNSVGLEAQVGVTSMGTWEYNRIQLNFCQRAFCLLTHVQSFLHLP